MENSQFNTLQTHTHRQTYKQIDKRTMYPLCLTAADDVTNLKVVIVTVTSVMASESSLYTTLHARHFPYIIKSRYRET